MTCWAKQRCCEIHDTFHQLLCKQQAPYFYISGMLKKQYFTGHNLIPKESGCVRRHGGVPEEAHHTDADEGSKMRPRSLAGRPSPSWERDGE